MSTRCECGGVLKHATLSSFDFTPFAGIPTKLVQVPGLRCSGCKRTTLEGGLTNLALRLLALAVARHRSRLTPDEARYLRKYLRLTQQALSQRMGVARETVADWERGENAISPQHDLILRAFVIAELARTPGGSPKKREVVEAISAARLTDPPKGAVPPAFVIDSFLKKTRPASTKHR